MDSLHRRLSLPEFSGSLFKDIVPKFECKSLKGLQQAIGVREEHSMIWGRLVELKRMRRYGGPVLGSTRQADDCLPHRFSAIPAKTCRFSLGGHVLLEPAQGALQHIPLVIARDEVMALVWINHQLRGHMLVAQRMPELKGLRHRAFAVAVAYDDKGRRLDLVDK